MGTRAQRGAGGGIFKSPRDPGLTEGNGLDISLLCDSVKEDRILFLRGAEFDLYDDDAIVDV